MSGVFSGGDCVSGPATVIRAIAAGKVAAANIDEYLGFHHPITLPVEIPDPVPHNRPACGATITASENSGRGVKSEMVNATINGKSVQVPENTTILEAAKLNNITIPHLCYLKKVNEIGACRVCVPGTVSFRGRLTIWGLTRSLTTMI